MSKSGNGFSQKEFNDYIVERSIVGLYKKPVKLSSGRMSPYYIDWKFIMGDSYSMSELVKYVISFTKSKGLKPRSFIGVREGGSPLGVATTIEWARLQEDYGKVGYPIIIGRGKPKDDHGDPKYREFVGGSPREDTVVLEDVATTGTSMMKEVKAVQEAGGNVLAVVALTDRCEKRADGRSVEQFLGDNGINYYPMSNSVDLIREVYKQRQDGPAFKDILEAYFEEYGIRKLNLDKIPHMLA